MQAAIDLLTALLPLAYGLTTANYAVYFARREGSWAPVNAEELKDVASPTLPANGVALLNLERR